MHGASPVIVLACHLCCEDSCPSLYLVSINQKQLPALPRARARSERGTSGHCPPSPARLSWHRSTYDTPPQRHSCRSTPPISVSCRRASSRCVRRATPTLDQWTSLVPYTCRAPPR